ncbi:MAG: hypothetical protein ABL993_10555 [Vicinamibacterales bacterium]
MAAYLEAAIMRFGKHLESYFAAYVKGAEIALIAVGLFFTVEAIRENTKSNLTASRSQLYESEGTVNVREFGTAASSLQSIYAHPPDSTVNPEEYCQVRLKALAADASILQARNVAELYEAFEGLPSYHDKPSPGIVQVREAYIHLSSIFGLMHSAQDYKDGGVLSADELKTWLAYSSDIGPHPLLLVTVWNWHEAGYMSREFAAAIRQRLIDDAPRNRAIIEYFYPAMLTPQFLTTLPDYR